MCSTCLNITWEIRKHRCIVIFNGTTLGTLLVTKLAIINTQNHLPENLHPKPAQPNYCIPPTILNAKLNIDAMFLRALKPFGIGFLLRNTNGKILGASTYTDIYATSKEVEFKTLGSAVDIQLKSGAH